MFFSNDHESKQMTLFESETITGLDSRLWHGSFNGIESTLQQLSPYVGKLKTGMVKVLLNLYSKPGETVLDPFSGSGVVPLEAVLHERYALANDLSPYAYMLTRGKLEAPNSELIALKRANRLMDNAEELSLAPSRDLSMVPQWVRDFFHPRTLSETLAAFEVLKQQKDHFLTACLLGILHHVRPGFLSYPASHLVPYLRRAKYPPEKFPSMYAYRDVRSRLVAKVKRAFRRHNFPSNWNKRQYQVWQTNAMNLPIDSNFVDSIISSPPYFGALDYARDNRLRLWFLGCEDWKVLDNSLTASSKVYLTQMSQCLQEMFRVLRPKGFCVLVLGDVENDGKHRRTAELVANLATQMTQGQFVVETIFDDRIPDERRARRKTKTTVYERILVMRKQ